MRYNQLVLVEFENAGLWLRRVVSDTPITLDRVVQHFTDTEYFDEKRDRLSFLSEPEEIQLTSV